jgi:hypothetical protein
MMVTEKGKVRLEVLLYNGEWTPRLDEHLGT